MGVKLPEFQDLGGLPSAGGARPIGKGDPSPIGRGAQAMAQAGVNFGKAVGEVGEAVGQYGIAEQRYEYATAHADFLAKKIDLDASLQHDQDYGTLPKRYDEQITQLQSDTAAKISNPAMRSRFEQATAVQVAEGKAKAGQHAFTLEGNAAVAGASQSGQDLINKAITLPVDSPDREAAIAAQSARLAALRDRGFITAEQEFAARQQWAHQYAIADGLERSKSDPQGVINNLRAAPGSPEQITNRIREVEGVGKDARSSAVSGMIDKTWLDLIKREKPELAKDRTDDELLGLRADRGLVRDMTEANRKDNEKYLRGQGLEPTAGAQYLAHLLGPAGAAAVLKAPPGAPIDRVLAQAVGPDMAKKMIEANPTILKDQLAGSVREWSNAKMGGVGPGGGHLYDILRPDQRAMLLSHAEGQLQKRVVDDQSAFIARSKDTISEAMNTGAVTNPMTKAEFIVAHGPVDGPKAYAEYKAQLQLGEDKAAIASMSHDEQAELLKKYDPEPGEGFADAAKRQAALATEIERVRKMRTADPEFQRRLTDSLSEATRAGGASKPIERDEFVNRFGSRDGPKHYAQYTAALRLGRDAQHVGELSPQEQRAMLGGYDPELQKLMSGTDYETAMKRRDSVLNAIAAIGKEKADDPAAFAIQRLPAVTEAYQKFGAAMADGTAPLELKQAAARDLATKMEMEQTRIGVPAEERTLLPKGYIDQLNAKLSKPAAAGGTVNVAGMIESEAKIWGDAWPQVYKQMAKGAAPVAMVIGSGVKPAAAQLLTEFANTKLGDIANDQSEERLKTIQKDVRDAFRPLSRSMTGSEGTQKTIDGFQAAGEKLAAYYVRQGKTSSDAAAQAFDDLLGHKYDFSAETYRVPTSIPFKPSQIALGVVAAKGILSSGGAPFQSQLDAADRELKLTPQERRLYERHLTNLTGTGGVDNDGSDPNLPKGSRSTLYQATIERDGKTYNIPTVWEGKILKPGDAAKRAEREGLDNFPSYVSQDDAEKRYGKMHDFMERDTAQFLQARRSNPLGIAPASDTIGGLSPEYLKRETARAYARDGQWVTSPDESGLALVYKDRAVRRSDGTPLVLTWEQLAVMGKDAHPEAPAFNFGG